MSLSGGRVSDRLPYVLGSLAFFALVVAAPRRISVRAVVLVLPVLLVADLFSFGGRIYALHDRAVFTEPPASRLALAGHVEPFGILTLEEPEAIGESEWISEAKEMLACNYNAVLGVESVNGFDSLMLAQIARASGGIMPTYGVVVGEAAYGQPQFQRFIDLLGARYVLVPARRRHSLDPARFRPVYRDPAVIVYENAGALPRFMLLFEAWRVTHEQAVSALATGRIGERYFQPYVALVEAPREGIGGPGFASGPRPTRGQASDARVEVKVARPGHVELVTESPADCVLVHATNYARGWKAFIDGAQSPIYRVDGLLQGIALPAGRHDVRFVYRPASFLAGAAISAATVLLGLIVVSRSGQRRKRRERRSEFA